MTGDAPAMVLLHLAGAVISFIAGTMLLAMKKGTARHKLLGRIFMAAMMLTAAASFTITSVNPGSFSPIHILSVITLATLPMAFLAQRRGNIRAHARGMILNYGGLIIAGGFALMPYRLLGRWLFGG